MVSKKVIHLHEVSRWYESGGSKLKVLDGISEEVTTGEYVAIMGESGCGKSTLLHLLAGLDQPSRGEIFVEDIPLHQADEKKLTRYRREKLGIIFQFFNLLPTMRVVENVMLPLLLQGETRDKARMQAEEWLENVELKERSGHFPHQLSGGEMQRTALAQALIHKPVLLLADEPTGNLDSRNAERVLHVFGKIASLRLTTMIIVTHSEDVARTAGRRIILKDGRVV